VREALEARGAQCEVIDPIALRSERASRMVANAYIRSTIGAKYAFGALYRLGQLVSKPNVDSPVYHANARCAPMLEAYLRRGRFDAVVATHLYPAEALTYLRLHGRLTIPFYAVMTDYCYSPFWEETRADVVFASSKEAQEQCVPRGMPAENFVCTGIPVCRTVRERTDRHAARALLGIGNASRLVVVMGGSMGCGEIEGTVRELLRCAYSDTAVVAICGNNEALMRRLNKRFGNDERLRVLGYTDRAQLWMEACDVLLTKPGGLTITEAAVKGVPLVLTAPIPGCETRNAAYFLSHKLAERAKTPAEAARRAALLIDNELERRVMQNRQRRCIRADAADAIAGFILSAEGENERVDGRDGC